MGKTWVLPPIFIELISLKNRIFLKKKDFKYSIKKLKKIKNSRLKE